MCRHSIDISSRISPLFAPIFSLYKFKNWSKIFCIFITMNFNMSFWFFFSWKFVSIRQKITCISLIIRNLRNTFRKCNKCISRDWKFRWFLNTNIVGFLKLLMHCNFSIANELFFVRFWNSISLITFYNIYIV